MVNIKTQEGRDKKGEKIIERERGRGKRGRRQQEERGYYKS
jgi:hypothetical protein